MPYSQGMTRAQGDPGFFGSLGKIIGGVAKFVPGPIGAIAGGILGGAASGGARRPTMPVPGFFPVQESPIKKPGARGAIERIVPGGETGYICPPKKKRRRMDPLNTKALARANRRQKAFLKAVDRTLATMPTKASVQKRRRTTSRS